MAINEGNYMNYPWLENSFNTPVSQFQGLGEMMGKGVDTANSGASKIGKFMGQPGMNTTLSGLAQLILAGGGVQGMPVNAVANGVNAMARSNDAGLVANRGNVLLTKEEPPIKEEPPVALRPLSDYTFGSTPSGEGSRLASVSSDITKRKPNELWNPWSVESILRRGGR